AQGRVVARAHPALSNRQLDQPPDRLRSKKELQERVRFEQAVLTRSARHCKLVRIGTTSRSIPVLAAVVVAAVLAPGPAGGGARPAAVSWSGGFTLPLSAQPVALTVLESGASAVVSLGPGHATGVQTSLARSSGRFGFSLPGRPW